jgi:hypothetical protein
VPYMVHQSRLTDQGGARWRPSLLGGCRHFDIRRIKPDIEPGCSQAADLGAAGQLAQLGKLSTAPDDDPMGCKLKRLADQVTP